jgi:3-carboxy-cis,cis-muconate cycloisomerase
MTLRELFASPAIVACFDDAALIGGMLSFERALARAQGACGVIPASAAARIDEVGNRAKFDIDTLVSEARRAGTLAIPFVRHLTAQVAQADAEASRYVHWGATSQDVLDTALVLCATEASRRLLERWDRLGDALAALADAHRATPTVARTLLQPATPIPFGFKAAVWLEAVTRTRLALRRASYDSAVLQFGGASGVLAPLGPQGPQVAARLAHELDLATSATPWHGVRDSVARLGAEIGIACEVTAKVALDIALLMQPEVGEAFEPTGAGRGGSSAMPHKRNPVGSMFAREAGLRAPGLVANLVAGVPGEHERGLGQWQSQFWTLGELFAAAGSGTDAMIEVLAGLTVDAQAMSRNLDAMRGFVYAEALTMALAGTLGKVAAHARVEALCRRAQSEGGTLQQALAQDAELSKSVPPDVLARTFEPSSQFGSAGTMIDRALDAWRNKES